MSSKIIKELLRASDYREFLRNYFSNLLRKSESYSNFAKRAGFASRNFPRDVTIGEKRITRRSLPLFIKGLNLEGIAARYFSLLVAMKEIDIFDEQTEILKKEKNRLKIQLTQEVENQKPAAPSGLYAWDKWPQVYASMGSPDKGASLEEI